MRLFIGIEFPVDVITALTVVQREIRANVERGRFKRGENFHLTLKFLGEVPPALIDELAVSLAEAAKHQHPFQLWLGSLGVFGSQPPIRVVWQGIDGELAALCALQQAVDSACAKIGFAREQRAYSPHITLAQDVIPLAGKSVLLQNPVAVSFVVREFALVLSEEKDHKRIYTPIRQFPLLLR